MKFPSLGEAKVAPIRTNKPEATETVVNTEITIAGACGPLQSITTDWDRELDAACARPGFQPLEYMTGVPSTSLPATIVHPYSFTTTFLSAVVARARSNSELAGELKRRIPPPESSNWGWSPHSAGALRKIAHLVQVRSAGLIAASTVGLLATVGEIALSEPGSSASPVDAVFTTDSKPPSPKQGHLALPSRDVRDGLSPAPGATAWRSGPEELVIAYTGGIIQHYPNFKEQCQRFIDRLVMRAGPQDGGKSVFLREARDGGIIGAGVLAGQQAAEQA
ncbi:hypothetical protein LTR40_004807 [Exophiala xenobiotica]|nr:hypothetical protein LTR40_004807 [Exophiala xenobiotica]